jgi:predicted hydrocarbon binding protein
VFESRKIPTSFLHFTLRAIDEIMGTNGLNSILNLTGLGKFRGNFPPNNEALESDAVDIGRLIKGTIDLIGLNGVAAILKNAGRRGYRMSLDENPELMQALGAELKKMPSDRDRIASLMGAITYDANRIFGEEHQELVPLEDGFEVRISECEWCYGIADMPAPVCFAELGLEEEAILWATGKHYNVTEIACRATGAERCIFRIPGTPRDEG